MTSPRYRRDCNPTGSIVCGVPVTTAWLKLYPDWNMLKYNRYSLKVVSWRVSNTDLRIRFRQWMKYVLGESSNDFEIENNLKAFVLRRQWRETISITPRKGKTFVSKNLANICLSIEADHLINRWSAWHPGDACRLIVYSLFCRLNIVSRYHRKLAQFPIGETYRKYPPSAPRHRQNQPIAKTSKLFS